MLFHQPDPEERILKAIENIDEATEVEVMDIRGLLQVLFANSIATNQLLQTLVNNTNPRRLTSSIAIKFTDPK